MKPPKPSWTDLASIPQVKMAHILPTLLKMCLRQLLAKPGYRNGQGNWTWTIFAQQADPDPLFEGLPDPDPGNDWTLEVVIEIQVPILTEIAV